MSGPRDWSDLPQEHPGASPRRDLPDFYGRDGGRHGTTGEEDLYEDDFDDAGWPVVEDPVAARTATRGNGRRRPRSGHPVLKALAVVVVLLVILVVGGLVWALHQVNPGGHRGPAVTVVIPKGSSTTAIGDRLASAGVIHNGQLFALYVRFHSYGPLYPGTYQLQKNLPYSAAIAALTAGPKILTDTLVIPEGYTVQQIAAAVGKLPGLGLSAQKFLTAADNGTVRSPYEPAGVNNLEGLLFPATYSVQQGQTEVQILEQMVGTFDDRVQSLGISSAATQLGLTPYQVITAASIVEREAKLPADRPNVASTIYNRLRVGMKLGADSTQTYYLRLTNPTIQPTAAQLDQPSPYNTRTNKGLPPTPIANAGMASLQAATAPPSTQYLYFVEINPDGQLGFAKTDSGFNHLREQCRAAHLC